MDDDKVMHPFHKEVFSVAVQQGQHVHEVFQVMDHGGEDQVVSGHIVYIVDILVVQGKLEQLVGVVDGLVGRVVGVVHQWGDESRGGHCEESESLGEV